jgi:hypothetical protein
MPIARPILAMSALVSVCALAGAPAALAQTDDLPGALVCALEPGSVGGTYSGDGADSIARDLAGDPSLETVLDVENGTFEASGEIACGLVAKGGQADPPDLTDGWEIEFYDASWGFICGSTGQKNGVWRITKPPWPNSPGVSIEGNFGLTMAAGVGDLSLSVAEGSVGSDSIVGGNGDGVLALTPTATNGGTGVPGVIGTGGIGSPEQNVTEFGLDGSLLTTIQWEDT